MNIVSIKNGHLGPNTLDVYLNGKKYLDNFTINEKKYLLEKANETLDSEIFLFSSVIKDDPDGIFFWCSSFKDFRPDALVGTINYYYVYEQLKHLLETVKIDEVFVNAYLPNSVISQIKLICSCRIHYSVNHYKYRLIYFYAKNIHPYFILLRTFVESLTVKSSNKFINDATNDVILIEMSSRHHGLLENIPENQVVFFSRFLFKRVNYKDVQQVNFFKYINLSGIISVLISSFVFKKRIGRRIKSAGLDELFFSRFSVSQTVPQLSILKLKSEVFEDFLKEFSSKISSVVVVHTLNDRFCRLISSIAFKHNIKVYINTCRPMITSLRAEDRLFKSDKLMHNNAFISDKIIVIDKFSNLTLKSMGFTKDSIILLDQFKNEEFLNQTVIEDGILILFEGKFVNNALINLFVENSKHISGNVYIRTHRAVPLTKVQQKRLKDTFGERLFDITENDWRSMVFSNVIAFNVYTTAGIEAVSCGAGLIWLPYILETTICLARVIERIGYISNSVSETVNVLIKSENAIFRKSLIEKCSQQYNTYFKLPGEAMSPREVSRELFKYPA